MSNANRILKNAKRMLKNKVGGSPTLRFTNNDAYNALGANKRKYLDGTDTVSYTHLTLPTKRIV